ncbi:MAG: rod shape-determining protein MreC [Epsilonproteobacteria bacterium]|nr:rod shape-determining protein MreC [Campylobacterota bacterium]
MTNRIVSILAVAAALFILYYTNEMIRNFVSSSLNGIKRQYLAIEDSFQTFSKLHFTQAETIQLLQEQNKKLEKYYILYQALKEDIKRIEYECNTSIKDVYNLRLVRALSYANFGDYTKIWLDTKPDFKIAGLLQKEFVAGIAIKKDNKILGLLNGNYKCSYGVKVGEKANGIAIGSGNNRFILVKYIPNYEVIRVGDQVKTNGLDAIFGEGLKVGVVVKIWQEGSYKVAKVQLYADLTNPRFFWLMKL